MSLRGGDMFAGRESEVAALGGKTVEHNSYTIKTICYMYGILFF